MSSVLTYSNNSIVKLDGTKIKNKNQFLSQIATKLSFPGNWGSNYDALFDMLTDLSWLGKISSLTIEYTNAHIFNNEDPEAFHKITTILVDSIEYWDKSKFKFNVIFS